MSWVAMQCMQYVSFHINLAIYTEATDCCELKIDSLPKEVTVVIFKLISKLYISLSECHKMSLMISQRCNAMVPSSNKAIPEPMLHKFYNVITKPQCVNLYAL